MKRRIKYAAVISIILAGVIISPLIKTLFEGDKGRIRRIIYAGKRATQQEDLFKCFSFISRNYSDKYGNNSLSLLLTTQRIFDTYDSIVIDIKQLDIYLETDKAKAQLKVTGMARNAQRKQANVFETGAAEFLIFFQREEPGWRIIEFELLESQGVLPLGLFERRVT
jgi:hypothetical protein